MKIHRLIALFIFSLSLSAVSHAQAVPMANRLGSVQIGAGFSFAIPDYAQTYIKGYTVYADADLWRRVGIEADVHQINVLTPTDIGEDTYLIGPRFSLLRRDRVNAYAKVLGGIGRFEYQQGYNPHAHTDTFGVFAVGGGIDFRASQHINIRAIDIEAQKWPGYGTPGFPSHGLTPFVTTFGVAYAF